MHVWHRAETRALAGGFFYCPKCKTSAEYRQITLTQPSWIEIWFWTVNKSRAERVREYVECCVCECRFEAGILRPDTQKLLWLVAEVVLLCRRGIPYQAIRTQMLKLAGSEYIADRAMQIALSH